MFTAASVMKSVWGCVGTSMMKTWLMRRPVRKPVSRLVTSASSSSECRLPFMSSSALPSRTNATARSAAAWLCGTSMISMPPTSSSTGLCDLPYLVRRTYEDGQDQSFAVGLQSASERGLVARMRHSHGQRRLGLGVVDQPLVLGMLAALGGGGLFGHSCLRDF